MTHRIILAFAALALTAAMAPSAYAVEPASAPALTAAAVPLPEIHIPVQTFRLENGMECVVIVRSKIPAVYHSVWYRTGAADEIPGKSGLAHFFEHLMFKGTKAYPKGLLSSKVAAVGGNDNAFTFHDATGYHQFVPKESLKDMMLMEADRMRSLTFEPEEIERERKVVLEERLMRTDNVPESRLWERVQASLYLNAPYGRPVIGWPHEIKALTEADLKEFYDNYYRPDNAVLVVAGDVDPDDVKRMAEEIYGKIPVPEKPIIRPVFAQEPDDLPPLPVTLHLQDPHAGADKWFRTYLAPVWTEKAPKDAYVHAVLAEILAGGDDSPLAEALVVKRKLAAGLDVSYEPLGRAQTDFTVSGAVIPGHTPAELRTAVFDFLRDHADELFRPEYVADVKDRMIASRIFASEDLHSLAYMYGKSFAVAGSLKPVEGWTEGVSSVTEADLRAALTRLLASTYAEGVLTQTQAKK